MHAILNPYMSQLGANLAPTWPPKSLQNRSQDGLKTQLPEKLIFATAPMRNASFCSSNGAPKTSKNCFQDSLLYECVFSFRKTSPQHGFWSFSALSWAPQGASKMPANLLQNHSWKHLGPSWLQVRFLGLLGGTPGLDFSIFLIKFGCFFNSF